MSICTSVPRVCSETMLSHLLCHVKVHFDKNPNNHCQLYFLTKGRFVISPAKNFSEIDIATGDLLSYGCAIKIDIHNSLLFN